MSALYVFQDYEIPVLVQQFRPDSGLDAWSVFMSVLKKNLPELHRKLQPKKGEVKLVSVKGDKLLVRKPVNRSGESASYPQNVTHEQTSLHEVRKTLCVPERECNHYDTLAVVEKLGASEQLKVDGYKITNETSVKKITFSCGDVKVTIQSTIVGTIESEQSSSKHIFHNITNTNISDKPHIHDTTVCQMKLLCHRAKWSSLFLHRTTGTYSKVETISLDPTFKQQLISNNANLFQFVEFIQWLNEQSIEYLESLTQKSAKDKNLYIYRWFALGCRMNLFEENISSHTVCIRCKEPHSDQLYEWRTAGRLKTCTYCLEKPTTAKKVTQSRRCATCAQTKSIEEFSTHGAGFKTSCKLCLLPNCPICEIKITVDFRGRCEQCFKLCELDLDPVWDDLNATKNKREYLRGQLPALYSI
jgi:16S rRNA G966 N2-methylase RsmD